MKKKTRHHVQNRDVFKNLMTWFQKTEHVCYTARHLSRPKMSLSCPFTTINIFDTLRPGVVMPFFSLMDGIDGGGRGSGGLESQSFDSSD